MKRSGIQGRLAWLDFLIGSICMGVAAMILQLFSRAKKDDYASDQQLRLMGVLLLGAVGFLMRPKPRVHREIQNSEHATA